MNPAQEPAPGDKIAYTVVGSPAHSLEGHPENASRFRYFERIENLPFRHRLIQPSKESSLGDLLEGVHSPAFLSRLRQLASDRLTFLDHGDTYALRHSYEAALSAAASAVQVVESVAAGQAGSGFALVRPPGHHASRHRAMGFCLLNNIALAARRAQALSYQKVMIVDFDVHHGNGTQSIFESDPDVTYVSMHQYGIYPGTGHLHEKGLGAGEGSIVNLPLPALAGDGALAAACSRVIDPLAARTSPDLMLVSAGFDGHWRDPLASLQFTVAGFYHLAANLVSIVDRECGGRIVFVLEGGYDPEALIASILGVFHALAGLSLPEDPLGPAPRPESEASGAIERAAAIHGL